MAFVEQLQGDSCVFFVAFVEQLQGDSCFFVWLLLNSYKVIVVRWYMKLAAIWNLYLPLCILLFLYCLCLFLFSLISGIDKSDGMVDNNSMSYCMYFFNRGSVDGTDS